MREKPISIRFERTEKKHAARFLASVPLQDLLLVRNKKTSLDLATRKAASHYERLVDTCVLIIDRIRRQQPVFNLVDAKEMWMLGDAIHWFAGVLKKTGFCLDGLYEHLGRDLGISRSLIEKVIIFRTYLQNPRVIPDDVRWKEVRDAPRRAAVAFQKSGVGKNRGNIER